MSAQQEPIRISLEEARDRYEKGNVTVLDVVDTESYSQFSYQIKRAIRINPEDIADEYSRLPQDKSVLTY
jgi:rhodanese-related sulfurtransferase